MAALVAASLLCRVVVAQDAPASETFYVNAETGDDDAPGTKEKPLRAIPEAARRVTEGKGSGPTTVVVSEGVHALDRTALFKPGRVYTKEARLTIRAEILPDDQDWNPARMPVVISTMPLSKTWMGRPDPFGGVSYGLQFETSHVTVHGLTHHRAPSVLRSRAGSRRTALRKDVGQGNIKGLLGPSGESARIGGGGAAISSIF
jgi:hypothetical protein